MLGSKSDLRLYALNAQRSNPKMHCYKLKKTVQIMAVFLIRTKGIERFL